MKLRYLIIGLLAAIFLLISIVVEYPINDTLIKLHNGVFIYSQRALSIFFGEISIAFIVGLIVTFGIEQESRRSDEIRADKLRHLVATDVFKGVFETYLPSEYIAEVIKVDLRVDVIRTHANVFYEIDSLGDLKVGGSEADLRHLLVLRARYAFTLINVSENPVTKHGLAEMPMRPGSLADASKLLSLRLGDWQLPVGDLEKLLVKNHSDRYKTYVWDYSIEPGGEIEIEYETIMIKERRDMEVWSSLFPTMRYEATIISRVPGLRFGLRERSAQVARNDFMSVDKTIGRWSVAGPMLPNNAMLLWWE